jgi:hypothetical protein
VFAVCGVAVNAHAAVLYVTSYGAACDGATDDTSAIQAAINAATSGDTVVFPSGACRYSNNITLSGRSNITLSGSGMDSTVIQATVPDHSAVKILNSSGIVVQDIALDDINATVRTAAFDGDGFVVQASSNINFYSVRVSHTSGAGIHIDDSEYVGVYDSELIETMADGVHVGGHTGQNYSVTIQDNYAHLTGDDSFSCVGYNYQNVYVGFFSNHSASSYSSGVTVEGCHDVNVNNNWIESSAYAGIRVGANGVWSNLDTHEVDVSYNYLFYVAPPSGIAPVNIFADGSPGTKDAYNIHVRNNVIYEPVSSSAINVYGAGGTQTVHDSEVFGNSVVDSGGLISDCIYVGSGVNAISVYSNTIGASVCN